MARSLNAAMHSVFRLGHYDRCYVSYHHDNIPLNKKIAFLEIPIKGEVFEVPTFAFNTLLDVLNRRIVEEREIDAIAVKMNVIGSVPGYKTLDRNMRDILLENYSNSRLVKVVVKVGNEDIVYYGTHGAVFDKDFNPLMMSLFQIKRIPLTSSDTSWSKYEITKPILRVTPSVYIAKSNPMERLIANKLIGYCLEETVLLPYVNPDIFVNDRNEYKHVRVELDRCPFKFRSVSVPSISTSNEKLIQTALDHLDELIQ